MDAVPDAVWLWLGVADALGVADCVPLGDAVALRVPLSLGDPDADSDAVTVWLGEPVGDGLCVPLAV